MKQFVQLVAEPVYGGIYTPLLPTVPPWLDAPVAKSAFPSTSPLFTAVSAKIAFPETTPEFTASP